MRRDKSINIYDNRCFTEQMWKDQKSPRKVLVSFLSYCDLRCAFISWCQVVNNIADNSSFPIRSRKCIEKFIEEELIIWCCAGIAGKIVCLHFTYQLVFEQKIAFSCNHFYWITYFTCLSKVLNDIFLLEYLSQRSLWLCFFCTLPCSTALALLEVWTWPQGSQSRAGLSNHCCQGHTLKALLSFQDLSISIFFCFFKN